MPPYLTIGPIAVFKSVQLNCRPKNWGGGGGGGLFVWLVVGFSFCSVLHM